MAGSNVRRTHSYDADFQWGKPCWYRIQISEKWKIMKKNVLRYRMSQSIPGELFLKSRIQIKADSFSNETSLEKIVKNLSFWEKYSGITQTGMSHKRTTGSEKRLRAFFKHSKKMLKLELR